MSDVVPGTSDSREYRPLQNAPQLSLGNRYDDQRQFAYLFMSLFFCRTNSTETNCGGINSMGAGSAATEQLSQLVTVASRKFDALSPPFVSGNSEKANKEIIGKADHFWYWIVFIAHFFREVARFSTEDVEFGQCPRTVEDSRQRLDSGSGATARRFAVSGKARTSARFGDVIVRDCGRGWHRSAGLFPYGDAPTSAYAYASVPAVLVAVFGSCYRGEFTRDHGNGKNALIWKV